MGNIQTIKDKDPWTGKEILRFPSFGRFNLHPYYSKVAFSPQSRYIVTSTPHEQPGTELKRGMEVPGSVQVLDFPQGTVHFKTDDVPVPMHGGTFEFSRSKEILAFQLAENLMGLLHLDSKKVFTVDIKGDLKSFGQDERSFIAVSSDPEGQWMYRLDDEGNILEHSALALFEELQKISPFENKEGSQTVIGNQKISDSGHFFMCARKLMNPDGSLSAKQLILIDLKNRDLSIPYHGDKTQYTNVSALFHHAAWVYGKDSILLHAMQEGKKRLTFRVLDAATGEDNSLYPVFGAKGHHSVMDDKQQIIITDSYTGDLAGVVSAIDLKKGVIHPLASWDIDETKHVEGHPSLSPDGKWVLYDCNVDGGSEVRAIRLDI